MSFRLDPGIKVFIYNKAIDMRSGFGKLQALVIEDMKENLFEGNFFLFLGNNRRRLKMLFFDGTGLVLIVKRLDKGAFMPIEELFDTKMISESDLKRLLDGANLRVVFAARKRADCGQEVA